MIDGIKSSGVRTYGKPHKINRVMPWQSEPLSPSPGNSLGLPWVLLDDMARRDVIADREHWLKLMKESLEE
jgi:hypothetical protein